MGCGATKPQEENYDTPVPEGDVDLASVKDFDQEQREAALRVPRDPSASTHATRSSYSYRSECRRPVGSFLSPRLDSQSRVVVLGVLAQLVHFD